MNLTLLKNIDLEKYLNEEQKLMLQIIGPEKFLELHETFKKVSYYFSIDWLIPARNEYILKAKETMSVKDIARETGLSEVHVYDIIRKHTNSDNYELFDQDKKL